MRISAPKEGFGRGEALVGSFEPPPEYAARLERLKETVRLGQSKRFSEELELPPRYIGISLTNLDRADDLKKRALAAVSNGNLYLWGPVGVGKTHFAVGLLNHRFAELMALKPGHIDWESKKPTDWGLKELSARFVSCANLLLRMKAKIGDDESDVALIDDLLSLKIVVLDDFGASRLTEYVLEMLSPRR